MHSILKQFNPTWATEPSVNLIASSQVKGTVTYNDRELDQFVVHRTAAFMDQQDNHIPCLTVRETLNFSARCQGSGQRPGAQLDEKQYTLALMRESDRCYRLQCSEP